ncbi:hypothetical protein ENBRE01_2156 [Enteropsectra breve]|nr:hypothetical protein ENBRE01_2156 [Enteropsectra breve]
MKKKKTLCNIVLNNLWLNAQDIANLAYIKFNKHISRITVRNILSESQLRCRIARKRPLVSDKNSVLRYNLSKKFMRFPEDDWKKVIFSDESSFELFDSHKHQKVYRLPNTAFDTQNLSPTVKFGGGKLMVWGCISYYGKGNLVFIEDTLDSKKYLQLLANNLKSPASKMGLDSFIFQQGGATCQTAKLIKDYLKDNNIKLLEWAAQLPDLNPIEHIWSYMKRIRTKCVCKNRPGLKIKLQEIWDEIPLEVIQNLILSIHRRINAVYDAKGKNTKY